MLKADLTLGYTEVAAKALRLHNKNRDTTLRELGQRGSVSHSFLSSYFECYPGGCFLSRPKDKGQGVSHALASENKVSRWLLQKKLLGNTPDCFPRHFGLPLLSAIVPGIAASAPVYRQSLPNLKTHLQNCIVLSQSHKLLSEYCTWLVVFIYSFSYLALFFFSSSKHVPTPVLSASCPRKLVVYLRSVHLRTNNK